ncbi:hypothetical protein P3T23_009860 [Paraburkholderia sp. GAS448]
MVRRKYGQKATRTPWRKMQLSIDPQMNIHAISITTAEVSDSEGMDTVLPANLPVDKVIADGEYYSIERTEALSREGTPVILLPAHAIGASSSLQSSVKPPEDNALRIPRKENSHSRAK